MNQSVPLKESQERILSIDLLRGLVMVIMALDHTRDFFHYDAFMHDPLDFKTTSVFLFFTRWITHFCAPVFVFLAGISIFLQQLKKSPAELTKFLLSRGLWLIFIELIVITFAWTFNFTFPMIIFQVIWAIGISMVFMSLLVRLPLQFIGIAGLIIVAGHNMLDYIPATHQGFVWDLVRNGNFAYHELGAGHKMVIIYPFLPWLGLMMLGYFTGSIFTKEVKHEKRKRWLFNAGFIVLALFFAIRLLNVYGNPFPWEKQSTVLFTILSFLNLHKYPPSLLFICMTIGPALIFLSLFEKTRNGFTRAVSVFGTVPFFYYILHFYILHNLCMLLFLVRGHSINEDTPPIFGIPFKYLIAGEGYSLTVVYMIWILLVVAMYPLCVWYSRFRKKHNYWWLSYI